MSMSTPVEELLTTTLRRAGELAVPEDLPLPVQLDEWVPDSNEGSSVRTGGRSARSWWFAVGGIAAVVLVAVGFTALFRSSPPITIERTHLSAAQGERLLCGAPGCVPVSHAAVGLPSRSGVENAGPAYGAFQTIPSKSPAGLWIVATNGALVRVVNEFTSAVNPANRSESGWLYLSAGNGRFYRFTTPGRGALSVVGHTVHTVTLKGANGRTYVLDLQISELLLRS
jgi:hypothetical protein